MFLLYRSINTILRQINMGILVTFDAECTKDWAKEIISLDVFSSINYNFDLVRKILKDQKFYNINMEKEYSSLILNIYNLIGDYAYQTDNKQLLSVREDKKLFDIIDMLYNKLLWRLDDQENKKSVYKLEYFKSKYLEMLDFFLKEARFL